MTAEAVTYSVTPPTASGVARVGSMRCGASPLKHLPSPRCANGTASRCRPLLLPSPGRGPGLTESESALRTSITVSLHSLITSLRHQRPSSAASHPCSLPHHISAASAPIIGSFASLLSPPSQLRGISAHHRQLRIIDRTLQLHRPSWADDRGSGHVFS